MMVLFALGLVMVVEGLAYALAPSLVERMLEALATFTLEQRRLFGLLCVTVGVLLIWFTRHAI